MVAAGLLAKKAVEQRPDDQALGQGEPRPRLEGRDRLPQGRRARPATSTQLRFNLVGYGCTTCIGNSGPLSAEISKAIHDDDLVVAAVLSGNRNFEGRINSDVRANYLASPPLVVAYALAGTMDIDLLNDPLGHDPRRQAGLPQGHLADPARGPGHDPASRSGPRCSTRNTARSSRATSAGTRSPVPAGRPLRVGRRARPTSRTRPTSSGCPTQPAAGRRDQGCPGAGRAGRQHHDRPHLARRLDQGPEPRGPVPDRARRRRSPTSTPTARGAATTR